MLAGLMSPIYRVCPRKKGDTKNERRIFKYFRVVPCVSLVNLNARAIIIWEAGGET